MSFFNQLPSTIDRDLSVAKRAIYYFDLVTDKYTDSDYAPKAAEKRTEARKMLAQKDLYIADFYFKRKNYSSALGRYEETLKNFSGLGLDDRTLYGAVTSSYRSGAIEKGENYYRQLAGRFPGSNFLKKAKEEKKQHVSQ